VVLSLERRTHHAEATNNYYGHQLVGLGSSADMFTAIHSAAERLEKQAVKAREKWRDAKRAPHTEPAEKEAPAATEAEPETERRVYHVNHHQKRKPITLEEALLDMEKKRDYLVYTDAETGRVSVLVRRRDGHFDLVEG
jgi:putative sigma-54 modulation protein